MRKRQQGESNNTKIVFFNGVENRDWKSDWIKGIEENKTVLWVSGRKVHEKKW